MVNKLHHTTKLTPEITRDHKIVELRRTGKSLREIGAQFGISYQRVRQIIERECAGELCLRCRLPDRAFDIDGLCAKCVRFVEIAGDETLTIAEAAKRAGVLYTVMQKLRHRFGVNSLKPMPTHRKFFRDGVPADVLDPMASYKALTRKYAVGRGTIAYHRKINGVTGKQRPNWSPGKRWTAEEDRILVEMRRAGAAWREIGERLGRTMTSCRVRPINQRRLKGIEMDAWIQKDGNSDRTETV